MCIAVHSRIMVRLSSFNYTQVKVGRWKQVCPDRTRRKVPMSKPSAAECVRSCSDFCAFMSRLQAYFKISRVYQTFVRSCSSYRDFTTLP